MGSKQNRRFKSKHFQIDYRNKSKTLTEHISQNVNVNLMLESAIQIKIGITINVDVSVKFLKNIMYAKKIIFVILKKMANILQVLFKLLLVESLVFVQRAYL